MSRIFEKCRISGKLQLARNLFPERIKPYSQDVISIVENICVPGISHAAAASCKGQQLVDLAVRIAACDPCHVGNVIRIHSDQVIVMLVIGAGHLARAVRNDRDADGAQFAHGAVVRSVADLLTARCRRVDLKAAGEPHLINHILEHGLCHCGTADVAVTYEQYFYHSYDLP